MLEKAIDIWSLIYVFGFGTLVTQRCPQSSGHNNSKKKLAQAYNQVTITKPIVDSMDHLEMFGTYVAVYCTLVASLVNMGDDSDTDILEYMLSYKCPFTGRKRVAGASAEPTELPTKPLGWWCNNFYFLTPPKKSKHLDSIMVFFWWGRWGNQRQVKIWVP